MRFSENQAGAPLAGARNTAIQVLIVDFDIAVIGFYNRLYQGSKKPWHCRAKVLSG